jgi:hypothetical protein
MRIFVQFFVILALIVASLLVGVKNSEAIKLNLARFLPIGRLDIAKDEFGRLTRYRNKVAVSCPVQNERTAVLLLIGQSNAANAQGQRYESNSRDVVNFAEGQCYLAESPLLGADGELGESWTLLATKLLTSSSFERVVLIPAAVGSTEVARWAEGGDVNQALTRTIESTKGRYRITHILWHQGESDFRLKTTKDEYMRSFLSLVHSIRSKGVYAPIFISIASFEQGYKDWIQENPVTLAQKALVNGSDILAGPDTDALVAAKDRYDGTHFSASGQEKFTEAWLHILGK